MEPVRASLDDTDLMVEALHEAERSFVLGLAEGGAPLPMTFEHLSKRLVGLPALPLEGGAPVVKEPPGPALFLVTPELSKRLFKQRGGRAAFGGRQHFLQGLAPVQSEVRVVGEQGVLLALDELAVLPSPPGVCGFADFVQGRAQLSMRGDLFSPPDP